MARPPGTGTGPSVGRVHLLGGASTQIRASGKTFAAAAGLPLLATDELVVPLGEYLVVALSNGHVVRIDEDLTLRVSEIVMLNVPPTKESLTAQLDRLLTKKERVLSERISGVQARRQGAEEMPVETSDKRKAKHSESNTRTLPVEIDPPQRGRMPAPQPAPSSGADPGGAAPPPPPPAIGSRGVLESAKKNLGDTPQLLLPKQNEAKQCLLSSLLPAISRVTIEVKLHAGHIVRVRLRGGLMTPACMPRLLLKQPAQGPDETWLRSEIVLR